MCRLSSCQSGSSPTPSSADLGAAPPCVPTLRRPEPRRRASTDPVAVVISIYINLSQFAPSEDLTTYPSDLAGDIRKLASTGIIAVVFCPSDLYVRGAATTGCRADASGGAVSSLEAAAGDGHETWIRVERLEKGLCGSSRVAGLCSSVEWATAVAKLFNIVEPDVAVFGKKDYQQWRVIYCMIRDLDFAIEIVGSEIVREVNGLAMSSRNVHLSRQEREKMVAVGGQMVQNYLETRGYR